MKRVIPGFGLSLGITVSMLGLIIAWVLVRYDFPGKKLMNGIIELPFSLPTAVAGISLTHPICMHHCFFKRNSIIFSNSE